MTKYASYGVEVKERNMRSSSGDDGLSAGGEMVIDCLIEKK